MITNKIKTFYPNVYLKYKTQHTQLYIVYQMRDFGMGLCVMEHPVNRKHVRNAVFRIHNISVRIRMRMRICTKIFSDF